MQMAYGLLSVGGMMMTGLGGGRPAIARLTIGEAALVSIERIVFNNPETQQFDCANLDQGAIVVRPVQMDTMREARGEVHLAATLIHDALLDAELPEDCEDRQDARLWLLDHGRLLSAQFCFEAIGIEYDAAMTKLMKRWG